MCEAPPVVSLLPRLGSHKHGTLHAGSQHWFTARCMPSSTARRAGACSCSGDPHPACHLQKESNSGCSRPRAGMLGRHCKMLVGDACCGMTAPANLPCHPHHNSQIRTRLHQLNPTHTCFHHSIHRGGWGQATVEWARMGWRTLMPPPLGGRGLWPKLPPNPVGLRAMQQATACPGGGHARLAHSVLCSVKPS